jgi:hypothetical protein
VVVRVRVLLHKVRKCGGAGAGFTGSPEFRVHSADSIS